MNRSKRYIPDLVEQSSQCERNYLKLMKLMPSFDEQDVYRYELHSEQGELGGLQIKVAERFKYTATVEVTQLVDLGEWLPAPTMLVRIYHDARMAEVIAYQNKRRFKGTYEYPNDDMHHKDEKCQLNRFLGQWLNYCMDHGCHLDSFSNFLSA
ncbi:DUF1249 domain-containing protein [Litoribrevibacter euphylliae]|uniref:DUF1249 domain-containing protein n=1 Tax=Litoribrevibacter euphylliae TaxID=1834034 RepID=A0ABV7HGX3_9GAMM